MADAIVLPSAEDIRREIAEHEERIKMLKKLLKVVEPKGTEPVKSDGAN